MVSTVQRRQFIKTAGLAVTGAALFRELRAGYPALKVGVTDWNLKQSAKPTSLELAQKIGFDGVEISLGRAPDRLPLSDLGLQEQFLAESKRLQFPIGATCLDILHQNYLKNDPLGKRWVAESIPISRKLGARVILLPFFGNGALKTREEMDYVADFMREMGPEAEKAGVILGLENTISAEDNARILERARSKAVLVYYDVGNSTRNGFDIVKEIRWLGRDRICEFHLKDNPHYLGKGAIDFPAVIQAIVDIGFSGWAQLETECPSGSIENDMRTNLAYIRGLLEQH